MRLNNFTKHDGAVQLPSKKSLSRRGLLGAGLITAGVLGVASMAPAATRNDEFCFMQTAHGKIAYKVDGLRRGHPPLILLQRFRATIDDWDPLFIDLLTKHRQVIMVDYAGVGRSGGAPVASIEDMAVVADELLAGLGIREVDVLGWSMGGFVALELALLSPAKVRRLIIAGAGPGGITEVPSTDPRYVAIASKAVNVDEDFLTLFFPDSDKGRLAGVAYLSRLKSQKHRGPVASMAAVQSQGMAMGTWHGARDRLKTLSMPVLAANGVDDVLMQPYGTYVIAHEAPNAKAILYPQAGHAFLFQYAHEFALEIEGFLQT